MCARLKTCLLLSLAVHLAVLAWAAPSRRSPVSTVASAARWDAMMVDLPAAIAKSPWEEPLRPSHERETQDMPGEIRDIAGEIKDGGAAAAGGTEPVPAVPPESVPGRIVRNEEFARLAYVREMIAKTTTYYRSAPKGFEGILRSSLPPDALREDGIATVSIGLSASGDLREVDIRSDSSALRSALLRVPWETAPLPARNRIPCSGVRVDVSIIGERLSVGVRIL